MYRGFIGTFTVHVFSFAAAIWSLIEVRRCSLPGCVQLLLLASQVLVLVNSGLSLARYGRTDGYKLRKLHIVTLNASMVGSFSLIQLALYTTAKSPEYLNVVAYLNIIPFLCNVTRLDYRNKNNRSDAIVAVNSLLFLWICVQLPSYYAFAYAVSFSFGYFYVGDCGYFLDTEVPAIDIYQYIQCFLCFFTVYAFSD